LITAASTSDSMSELGSSNGQTSICLFSLIERMVLGFGTNGRLFSSAALKIAENFFSAYMLKTLFPCEMRSFENIYRSE